MAGISFKTQLLYSIVFITRYLDLFIESSFYRFIMKVFFIGSSVYVLYLMRIRFRSVYLVVSYALLAADLRYDLFFRPTHDPAIDTIRLEYLVGPAALLALLFHYRDSAFTFLETVREIFWAFSIYLEAVAILPQLFMLQRTGEAETITTHYLFALGAYRALYIPNWIYRCVTLSEGLDAHADSVSIYTTGTSVPMKSTQYQSWLV